MAMETAGRAVVFSGITVAIGLLALIALPLPFLRSMGYGGMLIPLVSTLVAITLLPVVLAKFGAQLDWPHRRTDDKASRAWTRWAEAVSRRRWLAAGAGMAVDPRARRRRHRTSSSAPPTPTRSRSRATPRTASSRSRTPGIGEGSLLPHEILIDGATDPDQVAARPRARSRGSTAPSRPTRRRGARTAPRSSRRSRSPTAAARRARTTSRPSATRRTPPAPTSRSAASRRRTTTSSTPSTAASR